MLESELGEIEFAPAPPANYKVGDHVVYPHHGAGKVEKKEMKELLGEKREYLTIRIIHNDMTVMVPCEKAGQVGLRNIIGASAVKKVMGVLTADVSTDRKSVV